MTFHAALLYLGLSLAIDIAVLLGSNRFGEGTLLECTFGLALGRTLLLLIGTAPSLQSLQRAFSPIPGDLARIDRVAQRLPRRALLLTLSGAAISGVVLAALTPAVGLAFIVMTVQVIAALLYNRLFRPFLANARIAASLKQMALANTTSDDPSGHVTVNMGKHLATVAGGAAEAAAAAKAGTSGVEQVLRAATDLGRIMHEDGIDMERMTLAARRLSESVGATMRGGEAGNAAEAEMLRRSAEHTASTAGELSASIGRMVEVVQKMATSSLETATSTSFMDDTLSRVGSAAGETADLSAKAHGEAERGYRAVHETLEEFRRARELVNAAHGTMGDLGSRVAGIGAVVSVIEEIAQKTNLLALNASIIAAQAGQHGRGFAVVASEIKALAQRTGASTKEIAGQIGGIQAESERAMSAMATGVKAVNQGFEGAKGAGEALGEIRRSSEAAQEKIRSIALILEEQADVGRRVADATNLVSTRAQEVGRALIEQSTGGERIRTASDKLVEAARRLEQRSRQSQSGCATIEQAVSDLIALTQLLERKQKDRARNSERLQSAVAEARQTEATTTDRVRSLTHAAAQLQDELSDLQRKLVAKPA